MAFSVSLILLVCVTVSQAAEVCYQLGGATETCFSDQAPFTNSNGKLPQSPATVGTTFNLKTRSAGAIASAELSGTSLALQNRDTIIIVHGYTQSQGYPWVSDMVNALLDKDQYNVIVVDWSQGAVSPDYYQAVANTRLVGAQIAFMVDALEQANQISKSRFHIIGHSLGAHIAGYAGKRLPGLGRISGLDPAGPAFGTDNAELRLAPGDASFVDVLHTDNSMLGLTASVGTADFYANQGKNQPGCRIGVTDVIRIFNNFAGKLICSHMRAVHLFTQTIKESCPFQGKPCAPEAVCDTCGDKGCARMGFNSAVDKASGSYYLSTSSTSPFC